MATSKKKPAAKTTKRAAPRKTEDLPLRVMANRITHAQHDALSKAAKKLECSMSDLILEGLHLVLAKRGEKTAAERFKPEVAS